MMIGFSLNVSGQVAETSEPAIPWIDPYVGTWSSTTDSSTFQIELRRTTWNNGLIVLMGDYLHIVDGKELINTKNYPGYFWIIGDESVDSTSMYVRVVDKLANKGLLGPIRLIDSTMMEWKLSLIDKSTSLVAPSVPLTLRFKRVKQ